MTSFALVALINNLAFVVVSDPNLNSTGSAMQGLMVFAAGVLSFFSPCVIPLLPLYFGYLAGGTLSVNDQGEASYRRSTVLLHTVCFVIGISAAFFVLATAFTSFGQLLSEHRMLLTTISAILIIGFGIWMLVPHKPLVLQQEKRFAMPAWNKMNPLIAFIMGFLFSFGWTPCVGPLLSSALILAANGQSALYGYILISLYTLGFIVPFLILGLFSERVLNVLKKSSRALTLSVKAAGVLLILVGLALLLGWFNGLGTAGSLTTHQQSSEQSAASKGNAGAGSNDAAPSGSSADSKAKTNENPAIRAGRIEQPNADVLHGKATDTPPQITSKTRKAPDFTLTDQNGNTHTLSDYRGKVVFLNFWATWCPPCKAEMPDIEKLYQDTGKNSGDVVVLGVANPTTSEKKNSDVTATEVKAFLSASGYTFPVVMDTTSDLLKAYLISAFPSTFIIDKNGDISAFVPGALSSEKMHELIDQAQKTEKK